MTIILNNKLIELEAPKTIRDLVLLQLGEKQNGIAVALNGQVKSKSEWETVVLNDQDTIMIIKATQGG